MIPEVLRIECPEWISEDALNQFIDLAYTGQILNED